jgi:hypothetical protein
MLSTIRATGQRGPVLLVLLIVAAFIAACGGAASAPAAAPAGVDTSGPGSGVQFGNSSGSSGEADGSGSGAGSGSGTGDGRGITYSADTPNLLIIKTGELVLQVTTIDDALTAATQQITGLGGYASGSDRSGDGESAQASITYRIPAANWDQALAGLRKLGTKVLTERSATQDVTGQVVDLGARIKNLQATETALQGIMARATEIKDVLAVQAELTTVRGQIEEATAEKAHLEEQAAFSTLTVTFSLKPDPVLTSKTQFDPGSQVDQAVASLVGVLQSVASAGIWFGIVWLPILIALGIITLIVIWVLRRFARPSGGVAPTTPTTPTAPTPNSESGA